MQQVLLTFCLVANLLACPLRCAACNPSAPASEQAQQNKRTCQCCAKKLVCFDEETPIPSEQPVKQSGDDCSCPNCICEGAILAKAPEFSIHGICVLDDYRLDASRTSLPFVADVNGIVLFIECRSLADTQAALSLRQCWRI